MCSATSVLAGMTLTRAYALEELEQLVLDRSPLLYPSQAAMARPVVPLASAYGAGRKSIKRGDTWAAAEPGKGRAVIVVKGPRLCLNGGGEVLRTADGLLSETRVMAAGELRPEVIADCMVVVGAPRWFPGHVFLCAGR